MIENPLRWRDLYREAELYKTAVRLYTKPLFTWRKALAVSSDGKTLYDFARHGLQSLETLHAGLHHGRFQYRPGVALRYNFNGKHRILYIYPWEERLVDLLLYRLLTRRLDPWLSRDCYAYRPGGSGIDRCQRRLSRAVGIQKTPRFVIKRDVANYFASVNHEKLLEQLGTLCAPSDPLGSLLEQRVRFSFTEEGKLETATVGLPFGTPIACLLANVYLTPLDRMLSHLPGVRYFRYCDDLIAIADNSSAANEAARRIDQGLGELGLQSKPSHERNIELHGVKPVAVVSGFDWAKSFRHLGLEFGADGSVGLSRDKQRKLANLFRREFRRRRRSFDRLRNPEARLSLAITLARGTIDKGIRNVALLDYYLRHTTDESPWRRLDLWLAEEVLSLTFGGGHRKGYFQKFSFDELRRRGLPSLIHRRRLLRHGHIASPFFNWKNHQAERGIRGMAVRRPAAVSAGVFSPIPEAAAIVAS